jgi:hypothetical protein
LRREMYSALTSHPAVAGALPDTPLGPSPDGKQLSLHKSWSCLNFLLTGKGMEAGDSILGKAILGGSEIPDAHQKMGYGSARYLLPAEVRNVFAALQEFPIEEKAQSFNPKKAKAAKTYTPNHEPEELVESFGWLREFYARATQNGDAVLLWIE